MNLKSEATQGYNAGNKPDAVNPFIWSSASWLAFEAGRLLWQRGATAPYTAKIGRGYSINIESNGGNLFVFKFQGKDLTPTMERKG